MPKLLSRSAVLDLVVPPMEGADPQEPVIFAVKLDEEDLATYGLLTALNQADYADMGSPTQITVTVGPGNTLGEDFRYDEDEDDDDFPQ
jgi:hypothetical protein